MTLEITSEGHKTNYDLDLIIIKRASETTAGVFLVPVHFNQSDHSPKNLRCVILRGDFKTMRSDVKNRVAFFFAFAASTSLN